MNRIIAIRSQNTNVHAGYKELPLVPFKTTEKPIIKY